MTPEQWAAIRHFSRDEWPKDPDKVHPDVVGLLDEYRETLGRPVVVLVAWDSGGHVQDSAHYEGLAVDFYVPNLVLADQWLWLERYDVRGVGLYPWWRRQVAAGVWERIPGLHVDLRGRAEPPTVGRRWWRDVTGEYRAVDRAFLRRLADDDFPPSNPT